MIYYQLKNYRLGKESLEEFKSIKINTDDEVFYGEPICLVEYGKNYVKPFLLTNGSNFPLAIEYTDLLAKMSQLKLFHLKLDKETGLISEVEKEQADISVRLPKDTVVEDLEFKDGDIYKVERIKEDE